MESIPAGKAATQWTYTYLSPFAKFLLDNHLVEFTAEQLRLCREVDLPLLKHLAHMPEDQLLQLSIDGQLDFLTHAHAHTLDVRLRETMRMWEADEMKVVQQDALAMEDFISGQYVRKQTLLKFLPLYTTDQQASLLIMKDIDAFQREEMLVASGTHSRIISKQLEKHAHFIERVTSTTPGAIAIYNVATGGLEYSNAAFGTMLGYSQHQLDHVRHNILSAILHPDDAAQVQQQLAALMAAPEGAIEPIESRLKREDGTYLWIRSYTSVFRHGPDGNCVEVIGFIINIEEEKAKQEELLHSREMLLEAQELAKLGSFIQDIEADHNDVTPQFLKIYELESADEVWKARERIHPADRERVNAQKRKVVEENGVMDIEFRYAGKEGEKIVWARGVPGEKNGRKIFTGTIMDITAQRHTLLQLQRSEILHKQAQLMSHIGNWTWNVNTGKVEWSDEMYRIHGVDAGAAVTHTDLVAYAHPEDAGRVQQTIQDALQGHNTYDMQYRVVTPAGLEKTINAKGQVLVDDNGQAFKMLGTIQDVTREHEIHRQLQESREFAQSIADTTPSLITLHNVKTLKCSFVNKAFYTLLGYDPDHIQQQGMKFIADIIHPDDVQRIIEDKLQELDEANNAGPGTANEKVAECTYRLKAANGAYRWMHTYITTFDRDAEGKVENVLTVSVDISRQVEAEQLMQHQNIQLKQSNKNLEEFAYVASHDLKEPLRKITTFGDRLVHSYRQELSDDAKMFLDKIVSSVRRMQTMVDDLMALSTIGSEKVFQPYSLNEILNETLSTLDYKIQQHNASIISDDLPAISMVPAQFRQLFQNLVSNALKFSHRERTPEIQISIQKPEAATIKQYGLPKFTEYIQINFADNGIGFDPQYAEKIFMTFQRLHGKSEYEGNGIGLSICRKVAENHNGMIFAQGRPGEGATFSLVVPVHQEALQPVPNAAG